MDERTIDRHISDISRRLDEVSPSTAREISDALIRRTDSRSAPPGAEVTPASNSSLAALIDHTALRPETTIDEIRTLCDEGRRYGFSSVCLNPCYVSAASAWLADSPVKVCTVIGFPLGTNASVVKVEEARQAIRDGAEELDMVIHVGMLRHGAYDYVEADIRAVTEVAQSHGAAVKVIIETCFLSDVEKIAACLIAERAGANFVKTSTGFAHGGATPEDVALMRRTVGERMGVKASGGIRTGEDARTMVRPGASRIGASASVAIVCE